MIAGHGLEVVGRDERIEVGDMILDVQNQILGMIREGKRLHEVIEARPTAAYDAEWTDVPGWGPEDLYPSSIMNWKAPDASPTDNATGQSLHQNFGFQ